MSLEHYQRILSLILTQEKERQLFLSDRKAFLSEFELPKETLIRLQKLDENELHESALALVRKRWGVVKSLLNLKEEFSQKLRPFFFQYALNQPMNGRIYKHQYDALAFIDIANSQQISKDFRIQLNERKKALQNYLIEEGELPKPKKFPFKFFSKSSKN